MYSHLIVVFFIISLMSVIWAKDLNAQGFKTDVQEDSRVWLIEFYSPMCGSCTEFAPTWTKIESYMKSVSTGILNFYVFPL